MSGKDNEFIAYLPIGFQSTSSGEYFVKQNSKVERKLTMFRYINGVILIIEYIEGDAKQVEVALHKRDDVKLEKESIINEFDFKQYSGTLKNFNTLVQTYRIKRRLYIVKAIAKDVENPIVKDFIKSVKLVNNNLAISPNVPSDVKSFTLHNIKESIHNVNSISTPADADRPVLVLMSPRPQFPRGIASTAKDGEMSVTLKIEYLSTGKIGNVEVVSSTNKRLNDPAIEAAKQSVFVPAEKGGVPVTVSQENTFSIKMTSSIRVVAF